MTDAPSPESYPTLECSCIIFRVVLRARSVDRQAGKARSDLFIRRPSDTNGLSVDIAAHCTPAECVARFNRTYGVWTLHVGRIRDIGLDVIRDGPAHANIRGVPYEHEDQKEALRWADLLAEQARPHAGYGFKLTGETRSARP